MKKRYTHSLGYAPTTPFTRSVILKNNYPKLSKIKPKPKNQSLLETIVSMLIGFNINHLDTPRGKLYTKILALYKSSSNNS